MTKTINQIVFISTFQTPLVFLVESWNPFQANLEHLNWVMILTSDRDLDTEHCVLLRKKINC